MSCDSRHVVTNGLLLSCLAALLGLVGCFKRGPEVLQTPISIAISSNNLAVGVGQSATITAVVYDQNSQGVQWTASPLDFGTLTNATFDASTLTATVTYTAPPVVANPTKITITATSITNPDISASLSFRFTPMTVSLLNLNAALPLSPQTLNPNDQLSLLGQVLNDQSSSGVTWSIAPPTGAGTIVGGNFIAQYTAPAGVPAPTTVVITATSIKDPSVSGSQQLTILPSGAGPNVMTLSVDGGPVPGHVYPNAAFTTIMLCNPGSSISCQTISGILVDTGSYGLRILQSAIPILKLPGFTDQLGNTLENCASRPDGSFLWGPVSAADVYIGGESGSSLNGSPVPIQVINSTPAVVPSGCSNGATIGDTTALQLGANGILGIGPEPTDCTLSAANYCDGSNQAPIRNLYYSCPSTGCSAADSPVAVPAFQQVANPIPFLVDSNGTPARNGVIIQLPAVSDSQASTVGTMIFGIGNQANNSLSAPNIITLDANDTFTTTYNGQTLTNGVLDSAQNALRFPDNISVCAVNTNYYCPASSPATLSATINGATQGQATISFEVDNADNLFSSSGQDAVFLGLAGPQGEYGNCSNGNASCIFVWGLPFFYGRTVYVAIDGQSVQNAPKTPWFAY